MLKKFAAILAGPLVLAAGFAFLPAQQPQRPVFSSNDAAERIPNLDTLKKELKEYHDCTCTCGCYSHDIDRQADRAIAFLQQRAARRKSREKLALILDIDETALSNYRELNGADFAFNASTWDAWIEEGETTAIPGTLRLYKEAQRLGVSIFFITGRKEAQRAITERNLRAQGFDNWKLLVMLPANRGSANQGAQTIGAFKAVARAQIAAAGYTLALNVGDQWSDLKGKPEAEYSVKYPDPYYFIP